VNHSKRIVVSSVAVLLFSGLGMGAANAVKPAQGDVFTPGTCTTTTGHGSNATQTTDTGSCTSADNPNQGGTTEGTNTGHGFVGG
jgi:hypothetical protein